MECSWLHPGGKDPGIKLVMRALGVEQLGGSGGRSPFARVHLLRPSRLQRPVASTSDIAQGQRLQRLLATLGDAALSFRGERLRLVRAGRREAAMDFSETLSEAEFLSVLRACAEDMTRPAGQRAVIAELLTWQRRSGARAAPRSYRC